MPKRTVYATTLLHRKRIDDVLVHIHDKLDEKIAFDNLVEISCYSPFHFQRLFTQFMGETWSEFTTRNRIYKAAHRLLETHEKIGDLAYLAGFGSQAGFGKAFKHYFGQSPSQYRAEYQGAPFVLELAHAKTQRRLQVEPDIVHIDNLNLLVASSEGCVNGRFDQSGWQAFAKLLNIVSDYDYAIPSQRSWLGVVSGISEFYRGDQAQYSAALEVDDNIDEPLKPGIQHVKEGLYAVFSHQGPLNEQTLNIGLFDWLPSSPYSLDYSRPLIFDFSAIDLLQFANVFRKQPMMASNERPYQRLVVTPESLSNIYVNVIIPLHYPPAYEPQQISTLQSLREYYKAQRAQSASLN